MSKLVTFEQAKKLKEFGYDEKVCDFYMNEDLEDSEKLINFNGSGCSNVFSAPKCSSALDWIREEKRVICAVDVDYFDGWYYTGKYLDKSKIDFQYTNSFDDHYNAESALLDGVLEYLEKKI